jgi:hypothetical protein
MLPWLFAVLLLLNLVFFYIGYQRELTQEPALPPFPAEVEEIRLLSEVDHQSAGGVAAAALGTRGSATADPASTASGEKESSASQAATSSRMRLGASSGAGDSDSVSLSPAQPAAIEGAWPNGAAAEPGSTAPPGGPPPPFPAEAIEPGARAPSGSEDQSSGSPASEAETPTAVPLPEPNSGFEAPEAEPSGVAPSETDLLPRDPFLNNPDMAQLPENLG